MALSETTRVCICHALIADPAAVRCDGCGRALCPHHSTWPMKMKWYLAAELLRSLFLPWRSCQQVWENLLRDTLNGVRAGIGPNPNGAHITLSTSAAELYPLAIARAEEWKANGSPLGPAETPLRRSA